VVGSLGILILLIKRYFKQGYYEGFADGLNSGPEEGFEFGHEVSFQKFLSLGIILGRCTVWRLSLSPGSIHPITRLEPKKARALRQIELLETMISGLDRGNESEINHGKFAEMRNKIMNKCRVIESLMGEERMKPAHGNEVEEEGQITLAKRMDRELQL
jgi:hypothetical protein